ncbi:MFS transporter [Kribbella shirazensis]|uniref:Putative MFS family arabinose efflux permease n=1 Tax=Kribbella shirazensis TaxID=1105143 RepID=A0A7X5VHP2_9ACTN|nr:MFS transporter [Kribbella shirazensis]NIK61405.1 putative MFS family arabinose efflux permease [Kribbella shirazensis]
MSTDRVSESSRRRLVLAVLALVSLTIAYSTLAMAPLLVQMADEYDVSVGRAGLATAAYGLPGAVLGVFPGPWSDRYGRKRFLVSGLLVLGFGHLATALAPDLGLMMSARLLTGLGFALAASSVQATIADHFDYAHRGRAVAVVMGAGAVMSFVGVPLSGILADLTTWRVSVGMVGVLAMLAFIVTAAVLPRSRPTAGAVSNWKLYRMVVGRRPLLVLLSVGFVAALQWMIWAAYVVVFFQVTFGLSQSAASLASVTSGLGALIGSQFAGWLGDRVGHRRVLGVALAVASAVSFALTSAPVGLVAAALLNSVLAGTVGARNVTHTALLTEELPSARATVMSIWASMTAASVLLGSTIGGLILDAFGFWLLGPCCCALSTLSAVALRWYRQDQSAERS